MTAPTKLWTFDHRQGLISMEPDHFMADCYTLHPSPLEALDAAAEAAAADLMEAKMARFEALLPGQVRACDSAIKNKMRILARIRGLRRNIAL